MRHSCLLWIAIFMSKPLAVAQPPIAETKKEADTKEFEPLANQLIDALQREDIVAFSQCWLSVQQIESKVRTVPKQMPDDELKKMKEYFQQRNLSIAFAFDRLVEQFKKQGNLPELKLISIATPGGIRERDGFRQVSMFYIKVKLGETESIIQIDDGVYEEKNWYFTDKPLNLEVGEKKERISLLILKSRENSPGIRENSRPKE